MRTLILVVCCLAGLPALDLSPLAGPDAPLYATRRESIHAQWVALTVESYATHGVHGAWDADMQRLLEHVALVMADKPGTMQRDDVLASAKRLSKPGACDDPLAAWAAHAMAVGRKDRWHAGELALKAFDTDAKNRPAVQRHPSLLEAIVAADMLAAYGRVTKEPDHTKAVRLAKRLATAIGNAIRQNDCAVFPAVLIGHIKQIDLNHQDFGEPVREAIDAAVAEAQPAPWVGFAMRGAIRIANAWAWRGSGWANSVTPEGWAGFERNLKEADALLTQAWQANPADPLAPAYACTLAGAGNSATALDIWMQRSMKACFDHGTAFNTAMNFMLPRWGGSYPQMFALGCDCLDTRRFDTEVPWRIITAITRAIRDAKQMHGESELRAALGAPRVVQAVEDCLIGYGAIKPDNIKRYACIRAAIHWRAGRERQAATALANVDDADLDAGVARDFEVDLGVIKAAGVKPAPDF